ncbi:MAG: alcohol dehydrogenase catalytic domain-containing protein [Candidatus Hydrogenedentes bacterium]|nr:alcohol dehydrogenase catalytic domain-containing protein [Candidatus Hydrogenedentota bacterium]
MLALVLEDIGRLVLKEVEVPKVVPGSILVKVHACAICGSDVRIANHGNPRVKVPAILGHESAGEVVSVGEGVTKFKVGDRVAIGSDVPCGSCVYCEAGIGNVCETNYAMGYQFPGSFAEYVLLNPLVVEFGPVHLIPPNLSYEESALAEPLACCLNALELTGVNLGETVIVIGGGPIGCMIMEVAKRMGAGKVIAVLRSRKRLEIVGSVADVVIISSEEDVRERVKSETYGLGSDVVITACSSPDAQADALHLARGRGRVNFFGGLPPNSEKPKLDSNLIHYRELLVTGAHGSVPRHHRQALSLIEQGLIDVRKYISSIYSLTDGVKAFQKASERSEMRIIVKPN